MADTVKIGLLTLFVIGLGILFSGLIIWLEVLSVEVLWTAALWLFVVPLVGLLFLAVAGRGVGFSMSPIWKVGGGIVILTAILFVDWYISTVFFAELASDSLLDVGAFDVIGIFPVVLVAVVFAIYEETFFTTVGAYLKAAQAPDILVILISSLVFTALHAWRYNLDFFYSLFLSLSRATLTAGMLKIDNTDINYGAHILYNVLVSVVG